MGKRRVENIFQNMVRYNTALYKICLPLPVVLTDISIKKERVNVMSTELLSSKVDLEIQNEDGNHDDDRTLKSLEQEIECHAAMIS
jgi:hypothetical protein